MLYFSSRIIFLLLTCTASASSNTPPDASRRGWTSSPNGRGTPDILWSSLFTVFVCCWTVVHRDIPAPGSSIRYNFVDKLAWLFVAAVAPEIVAYVAFVEYEEVRETTALLQRGVIGPRWSPVHSFYAQMGGFYISSSDGRSESRQLGDGYIDASSIETLIRRKLLKPSSLISRRDIEDKGKADVFMKVIALAQTLWLVLQCVARSIQHLPITTLEIAALAYVPCTILVVYLWWHKPMDVNEPTQLILQPPSISQQSTSRFTEGCSSGEDVQLRVLPYSRFPLVKDSSEIIRSSLYPINRWGFLTGTFCLVFGGIHCCAWNFSFVSPQERWAWRICSVILTVSIPSSWLLTRAVLSIWLVMSGNDGRAESGNPSFSWKSRNGGIETITVPLVGIVHGLGMSLYVLARLYLLVEVFLSLRSLPAGCYVTVDWLRFWPHV